MKSTEKPLPSLILCIIMDLIGYASFTVPILGEFFDVIWAPVAALIFNNIFGGKVGIFGGALTFLEELLPFTDFIPSFSIAWFIKWNTQQKQTRSQIQLVK